MASLRFWARRTETPPPPFWEPTPYCDRLTLADAFAEDKETRPTAEDRRPDHKPIGGCVEGILQAVAPPPPSGLRRRG